MERKETMEEQVFTNIIGDMKTYEKTDATMNKKVIDIPFSKEEKVLKKIYFISNPISSIIKRSEYTLMFNDADRSAETGKIISLLDFLDTFQAKIKFFKSFTVNSQFLMNTRNISYYRIDLISFILVLLINFLSILFSSVSILLPSI